MRKPWHVLIPFAFSLLACTNAEAKYARRVEAQADSVAIIAWSTLRQRTDTAVGNDLRGLADSTRVWLDRFSAKANDLTLAFDAEIPPADLERVHNQLVQSLTAINLAAQLGAQGVGGCITKREAALKKNSAVESNDPLVRQLVELLAQTENLGCGLAGTEAEQRVMIAIHGYRSARDRLDAMLRDRGTKLKTWPDSGFPAARDASR